MTDGDESREHARFMFFHSFCATVEKIKNPEDQLATFWAIVRYGLYGVEPTDGNVIAGIVLESVRPIINQSRKLSKIRSENGAKGGRPKNFAFGCDDTEKQTKANETSPATAEKQIKATESGEVGELVGELVVDRETLYGESIGSVNTSSGNGSPKPQPKSPKSRPPTRHGKALEFWKTVNRAYPAHRRVYDPPVRILRKIEEKRLWERTDEILSALESWKSSKSWREDSGKFIPSIRRFVEEGVYEAPPEEPTTPKSAYDTTQARGDALERSLAESKKNRPEIQII